MHARRPGRDRHRADGAAVVAAAKFEMRPWSLKDGERRKERYLFTPSRHYFKLEIAVIGGSDCVKASSSIIQFPLLVRYLSLLDGSGCLGGDIDVGHLRLAVLLLLRLVAVLDFALQ